MPVEAASLMTVTVTVTVTVTRLQTDAGGGGLADDGDELLAVLERLPLGNVNHLRRNALAPTHVVHAPLLVHHLAAEIQVEIQVE
eukprot:1179873-Prorocentrum_minimum.AAC.1